MSYKDKIYLQGHNSFFDGIIVKKRIEISEIVNKLILKYNLQSVTDIGTTSDDEFESSNLIIKNLKNLLEFKSISNQEINSKTFSKTLIKSITSNFTEKEIKQFSSDLVISSATIEHVGSYENQKKMVDNIIKLTNKIFVITTPNKFYPIEFHSKIPFFHWLPNKVFGKILSLLGNKQLSNIDNLNLLSKGKIIKILNELNFKNYKFEYIKLFLYRSNIILVGFK